MKARADRQRATRDRIIQATVDLHREVGPARTSIADIARRAGVQRLTVYNTFPTPSDLFKACQQRFLADSPPPDVRPTNGDPGKALERALLTMYEWYAANEPMERHVHRDRHLVPQLDELMAKTGDVAVAAIADAHAGALARGRPSPALRAFIRLAFDFGTWEFLSTEGLASAKIARTMAAAAKVVLGSRSRAG
jgi:AcrR family transcriptional regulator